MEIEPQQVSPPGEGGENSSDSAEAPGVSWRLSRRGDPTAAGTFASGGDCKCSTITAIAEEWVIFPLTAREIAVRRVICIESAGNSPRGAVQDALHPVESLCEVDGCAISGSLPLSAPRPESGGPSACRVTAVFYQQGLRMDISIHITVRKHSFITHSYYSFCRLTARRS